MFPVKAEIKITGKGEKKKKTLQKKKIWKLTSQVQTVPLKGENTDKIREELGRVTLGPWGTEGDRAGDGAE